MSKHPSDNTKRNLLRRSLAGILTLALLLSLLPSTLVTAHAASWADPYVQTLAEWGVMRGDVSGNMDPDRSITRAEFVTMMNRAYGYTKLGGNPFTDVRVPDWYYEDVDIAYNIGYFQGTSPTTASPNDSLTREQAAVLLARNMVLQPTVGETLGFSDSRSLNDWSRGLVGAAAANGIISGYEDGTFRPEANITRGEVAAMLVRAIGTPIQTSGDHALGNVYGNVTVNTSGVKLRDGVIVGNLYLTGGIDLGDILLENITVLGEIIVSGGGESNSGQSSIIMRNVVADNMVVDSIGDQFITIRAEGNTDIPTTTVRTSAYVDDYSLPGYGLSHITLDGENGALYQLAGNIKEVVNLTPGSSLQIVQGTADKVTMDEYATGSNVLVDGDAVVGELNLDVATNVTGTGDIKNLNVGAAGSTVEQLPDNIDIRPGITTDINGSSMNSTQGAESSSDPKLLAGYPAVKNIAPTSATLVFQTNKPGTVYWAVTAVSDGSVSEAELLEPPTYGNKILASGSVTAASANTDYTAAVARLTSGGSYYVTAMLVDGRDQHSPIKVTSFSTPDNTVPAFATGYPVMTKITCDEAQVTVMTTKSCLLYYALLPQGAAAPTTAELKSAAVPGNLGYGTMTVTKNVTIPFQVNNTPLDEKTPYVLYLWLTDVDGAQSAPSVTRLPFTTPDETPPVVTDITQTGETVSSIRVEYTIDEPASLVWAIVTEGDHMAKRLLDWSDETFDPNNEDKSTLEFEDEAALLAAKVRLVSGSGALASGTSRTSPLNITNLLTQNTNTSSYVLYYIANDNATATGNLSLQIKALRVHTLDNIKPTASLRFTNTDGTEVTEDPQADASISIIFSENVKGSTTKGKNIFLTLYSAIETAQRNLNQAVTEEEEQDALEEYESALNAFAKALSDYITLYSGTPSGTHTAVDVKGAGDTDTDGIWINWRNAVVEMMDDGTGRVRIILPGPDTSGATPDYSESAVKLDSGASYYFHLAGIYDTAVVPNPLDPSPCDLQFVTSFAKVQLEVISPRPAIIGEAVLRGDTTKTTLFTSTSSGTTVTTTLNSNHPTAATLYPNNNVNAAGRIDRAFQVEPLFTAESVDQNIFYDFLIWSDTNMEITLYSREKGTDIWEREGSTTFRGVADETGGYVFRSLAYNIRGGEPFDALYEMTTREYAIHVDKLNQIGDLVADYNSWSGTVNMKISVVAGSDIDLESLSLTGSNYQAAYDRFVPNTLRAIGTPDPLPIEMTFTDRQPPSITAISLVNSDTSPVISVIMDHPGSINYIVFPLTNLTYNNSGTTTLLPNGTQITEAMIQGETNATYKINGYSSLVSVQLQEGTAAEIKDITTIGVTGSVVTGTPIVRPSADLVIDGTFEAGVIKGRTNYVAANTSAKIDLSGQTDPNTVYVLILVPQGTTSESYASQAVAYHFITEMASRPVITLNSSGSTTVTATVDRSADLSAKLLVKGQLSGTIFNQKLSDNLNPNMSLTGTDYENITVLDALVTNAVGSTPGKNGSPPSVFDVYASDAAKNEVQQVVGAGGSLSNTVVGSWGIPPVRVTVASNSTVGGDANVTFDTTGLSANVDYVCVAMAKSTTSDTYGFRAVYPLQLLDNAPPKVTNVTPDLVYDAATGKVNGEIFINFDRGLYRQRDHLDPDPVPVVQSPNEVVTLGSDEYLGLSGCLTALPVGVTIRNDVTPTSVGAAPIGTIVLSVKDRPNTSEFSISFAPNALISQWGTPVPRGGTITITYTPGADGAPGTFSYTVSSNLQA